VSNVVSGDGLARHFVLALGDRGSDTAIRDEVGRRLVEGEAFLVAEVKVDASVERETFVSGLVASLVDRRGPRVNDSSEGKGTSAAILLR
jgi:hypothetical protein